MYITLDIGGTKGRIALFAGLDKKSLINIVYISIQDDFENDIQKIFNGIESLSLGKQINKIVIGIAGFVNEKGTGIMNSANLKQWENKDISNIFENKYSCKTIILNDTFLAGYAEAVFGEIKEDFLYINWGTGIGGCLVNFLGDKNSKGNIFEVRATEMGHQIIKQGGKKCHCGQSGCLDAYLGGKGIEDSYKKKPSDLTQNEWNEVIEMMATGIMNAIVVYPVKFIIFGGGIAINQAKHIEEIQEYIFSNLKIVTSPKILITSMHDHPALYGGLALLRENISL
jgi:predicted NBD/HSP70 family sugar kinase